MRKGSESWQVGKGEEESRGRKCCSSRTICRIANSAILQISFKQSGKSLFFPRHSKIRVWRGKSRPMVRTVERFVKLLESFSKFFVLVVIQAINANARLAPLME